jgi:hypothetical protein
MNPFASLARVAQWRSQLDLRAEVRLTRLVCRRLFALVMGEDNPEWPNR